MLYDNSLKEAMLDVLHDRVSSIADSVVALAEQGFVPNKNKITILSWSLMLIDAYENIEVLNNHQQHNLDKIYNKVLKL